MFDFSGKFTQRAGNSINSSDRVSQCSNCSSTTKREAQCFFCGYETHLSCDQRYKDNKVRLKSMDDVHNLMKSGFKYICIECTSSLSSMSSFVSRLGAVVSSLDAKVSESESQLSRSNVMRNKGESYADALRGENVIMITSNNNGEVNRDIVKKKLSSAVAPEDFKISGFHNLPGNKVLLKSKGGDIEKLVRDVRDNMGKKFEVKLIDKKKPKLKVIGIEDEELSNEEIERTIKSQNDFLMESDEIKVIKSYKSGKNKTTVSVIIEVDMRVHKSMLEKKLLFVGWSRCRVFDATQIARCYKCSRLWHIEHDCKNDLCCAKCSGPHRLTECDSQVLKCVNCCESNEQQKLSLNTNHAANDPKCETMLRMLKRKMKNLNRQ